MCKSSTISKVVKLPSLFLLGVLVYFFSTVIFSASVFSQTIDTLWFEDWTGDWFVNWHASAGTWEVGIPTSGPNAPYSDSVCAATVLAGNYSEPVDSRLIRHTTFIVPDASLNPRLRFWHWYSFSAGDWGKVEISTDGGASWQTISTNYTSTGSGVWTYPMLDISPYAGQSVQIAFYFHSQDVFPPSGGDVSSGWYIDDVAVITGPLSFNNPEGFELGIGNWASERGTWEVGIPSSGPGSAYAGQNCAATKLSGNYYEPVDSRLISPPFIVPGVVSNPRLRFWHWYSFSSGDYGEVQIRVVGGSWQTIFSSYTSTSSSVWTFPLINLTAFADSMVQIAFRFYSADVFPPSGSDVSSGWYIDEVEIATGPSIFPNPEDFEGGLGDWYAERGTWEVGVPTFGPSSAHSGVNCAGTVLGGNYREPVSSNFISPSFRLPSTNQNPALQFWHWFSFSAGDYGQVYIRVGDGSGSWQPVSNQFTSTSSGIWSPFFIDLTAYADSLVQIAFYFYSADVFPPSGGDVSSGWYIDEVEIFPYIVVGIQDDPDENLSLKYLLSQNYPNPFNPTTTISYHLSRSGSVELTIYNMLGQEVRKLVDENQAAGQYTVQWDGRDYSGRSAASGVYMYRLKAGEFVETKKMLLLR